jgi:hypothetical protein
VGRAPVLLWLSPRPKERSFEHLQLTICHVGDLHKPSCYCRRRHVCNPQTKNWDAFIRNSSDTRVTVGDSCTAGVIVITTKIGHVVVTVGDSCTAGGTVRTTKMVITCAAVEQNCDKVLRQIFSIKL